MGRKWLLLAGITLLAVSAVGLQILSRELIAGTPTPSQGGIFYSVNTTSDTVVIGACQNGDAGCSLRGAIGTANGHPGADGIGFNLPAGSVINLTGALPDLTEDVSISGPGADRLTVRRDTGGDYGIFNVTVTNPGIVTFSGLTISNGNTVGSGGGGIHNSSTGTVNVTNCTVSGNSARVKATGGGIGNGPGTVNVTNCTVSGNSGGGITNLGGGVNVTNSTLSGNSGTSSGGGISNPFTGGIVNVTNSTLSGNSAGDGGGIFNNDGAAMNVKSSIIALNTAPTGSPDVRNNGNILSQGFNLIGKNDGAAGSFPAGNPNGNNDIVGTSASPVDPKLDPTGLQNNGGPTQTIALLFGSPAIDKGTSNGLTADQRGTGFARTFDDPATPNAIGGDGTDVGAFEVQTTAPTPTPTPTATPGASPTPTATPGTLGNISTRLLVETGDNVLIGGFIITGTQPKKVIVRAIGPSLPFVGALADPVLELRNSSGDLVASNDNWRSNQEAEIIATTIPPSNDLESAIVATLPANSSAYTAIVRGVNNGTGIGLVEAYDLDRTVDSKLANISTRGFVQTGDNVMIGGLIVLGQDPLRVIVRAIGPSLPVSGALGDPTLELHDGNGALIASNDNWRTDQEAEIIATTIPPTNDLESAIVRDLAPGSYTAIVRGVNNTTGVALVEAYGLN